MTSTPHFSGLSCVILHEEDQNVERLQRQLNLLGIRSNCQWAPLADTGLPDLILIDADQGWDEVLPFGGGEPPRPVIALLGTEAPGRIAWAIRQGATAFIPKPVTAGSVFPALVIGVELHRKRAASTETIGRLEERLRLRPVVFAAIERIAGIRSLDRDAAYRLIREAAMHRRQTVEEVSAAIIGSSDTLKEVS